MLNNTDDLLNGQQLPMGAPKSIDYDTDFSALFLNPLIHLIDEQKQPPGTTSNRIEEAALSSSCSSGGSSMVSGFMKESGLGKPDFLPPFSTGFNFDDQRSGNDICGDRKKLFVGNLPPNTSLPELVELFKQFGRVNEQLSVVKDDNYAFIHFYSEKDAISAFKGMNDVLFKNRYIRVQYSTSRGHIKKSKTFDSMCEPAFGSANRLFNDCAASLTSINEDKTPLGQIPQFSNKFTNSASMYELPKNSSNCSRRPITGGNRRGLPKPASSFNMQSLSTFAHSQSLLIPVNSEQNRQNQVNLMNFLKNSLSQQQEQFNSTNAYYGSWSRLPEPPNQQPFQQTVHAKEFRLFNQNESFNMLNFLNISSDLKAPEKMVKSNTVSSFLH